MSQHHTALRGSPLQAAFLRCVQVLWLRHRTNGDFHAPSQCWPPRFCRWGLSHTLQREKPRGAGCMWLEQCWMPSQVLCTGPEHPFLTSPLAAACWKGTWASVAWGEASSGAFWLPLGPREPARSPSPSWWGSQTIGLRLGRGVCVWSYFYLCVFRKFLVATGAGCVLGNGAGRGTGRGGGNVAKTGLFSARAIFLFLCCSRA